MASDERIRKRLAKKLRALRLARGLSQFDLVVRYDFSLSHYQKLERGTLDARLSTLAKLASCFGVTLSELLSGV